MLITVVKLILAFVAGSYLLFRFQPSHARLSLSQIIGAYTFRILLGCLYGYLLLTYYPNDDTATFHQMGIDEYHELIDNPRLFFTDFFSTDAFRQGQGFWQKIYYYLLDWEKWILIKLLAIFNCFSSGNYYVNVILLNIISLKGCHYLYAALRKWYAGTDKFLFAIIFFFPPIVFWLSGIRGEALLIFFIGLLFFVLEKPVKRHADKILIVLSLAVILAIRNQIFLLLLPALVAYFICRFSLIKPSKIFGLTYLLLFALIFTGSLLPDSYNVLYFIAQKQAEYKLLSSHSIFYLPDLHSSAYSYLQALPFAILNTFFRPLFIDAKGMLQLLASVETLLVIIVSACWVVAIFRKGSRLFSSPFLLLLFFFSITCYLMIGFVVPFPGAIIRYRSIPELTLLLCLAADLVNAYSSTNKAEGKLLITE